MSETINVAITATSAELEAALAKASAAVGKFEQKARSARQIGLPAMELTPQSLQAIEKAAFLQQNLTRATYQAGAAGKSGALGFLAFSQAVEDAQYGIKGVLNNIPQMILGFGGTAGLAGAISLVAVAAYGAYQAFQKLSGINDMEQWAKDNTAAADAFTESLRKSRKEAEALADAVEFNNRLGAARRAGEAAISRGVVADPLVLNGNPSAVAAIARARASQDAVMAAVGGATPSGLTARQQAELEWQKAGLKYTTDQKRLAEDLATSQEQLNKAGGEYERIWKNLADVSIKFQQQKNQLAQEEIDITKDLAARQAEAAALQVRFDTEKEAKSKAAIKTELDGKRDQIDSIKAVLTEKQKEIELADDLIAKTGQEGEASKKALDARLAKLKEDIAATKDAIKASKALARVEAEILKITGLQKVEAELKKSQEKANNIEKATNDQVAKFDEGDRRQQNEIEFGRRRAERMAETRDIRRQAEEIAKVTAIPADAAEKEIQRQKDLQNLIDKNQGSLRERSAARSAERAARREDVRNQRRVQAALNREERLRKRDKQDPLAQPAGDIRKAQEDARKEREKVDKELGKNIGEQVKLVRDMLTELKGFRKQVPWSTLAP